jgi:chromosomal replication initiation ATPase DnaA
VSWAGRGVVAKDIIVRDNHFYNVTRDQALYLARRATPLSLSELAKQAGLNQHASVAMAIKRYERDAPNNPAEHKLLRRAIHLLQITM